MKTSDLRFKVIDTIYIIMMILPLVCAMVIKILFQPETTGITIQGAGRFFVIPMPIQDLPITEATVNSALIIITIFFFCLYMTHGLKDHIELKRQHLAELIVQKVDGLVDQNMGEYFKGFSPFVIAILALSACSSLSSLLGLFPPTSDINIVAGWAILVFILITYYKMKCGPIHYLKSFLDPTPVLAPINFISEFATPVSMSFRHFGNILSGTVISVLISAALAGLSSLVLGFLPGMLGEAGLLKIGIPAIFSIYFDVFSGCLQAFIFATLTMINISGAFDAHEYEQRRLKKLSNNK